MSHYFVYILRCTDDSLYTGITTDLERRLYEHNHSERGARYTRGRRPVTLVYSERYPDRSTASIREREIKSYTKTGKEYLVENVSKT